MAVASPPKWPIPVTPLEKFLNGAYKLTPQEFLVVVNQAIVLLRDLYVHLPQKRASRGIDPVQRLRLLRYRLPTLTQRQFHDEMLSIFGELHDGHTSFTLPAPFAGLSAMVPFLVEECYENTQRIYLVTNIVAGFEDATFQPGVRVTHWNGVPIDRALEILGRSQLGSNPEAQRAGAVHHLTVRPMTHISPPDELTVRVRYLTETDQSIEREIDWVVGSPPDALQTSRLLPTDESASSELLGIDFDIETIRRVRKVLYAPSAMEHERTAALIAAAEPSDDGAPQLSPDDSTMPDAFSFRRLNIDGHEVGYLRIWTFKVSSSNAFIKEAMRILDRLPSSGLIIDVRDNGGGALPAAERLLQLLTPGRIEPERFQLVSTTLTQTLAHFNERLQPWALSLDESLESGAMYSAGFHLTPVADANDIGQRYQGPVVVITNALCYSATDAFVAGFQDHKIGKVLGVHHRTGAGGANVWEYADILQNLAGENTGIAALPRGSAFRVAIRRNTRVRERADLLVEEFGVEVDEDHELTRNDLLNRDEPNADLIRHAVALLAQPKTHWLTATLEPASDGQSTIKPVSHNLTAIDVFVDGRPVGSFPVTSPAPEITVTLAPRDDSFVELRGYDGDMLVAATRLRRK